MLVHEQLTWGSWLLKEPQLLRGMMFTIHDNMKHLIQPVSSQRAGGCFEYFAAFVKL